MPNRVLEDLQEQAEVEGFEPGTPAFESRMLVLRVAKCKEMQNVPECSACRAYDNCELAKSYLRLRAFGKR